MRLTQGQIAITDELTIERRACGVTITGDANGDDVTLAGGITDVVASLEGEDRLDDNSRIFDATADLTLDGLTFDRRAHDNEGNGGAVRSTGALTLIDSEGQRQLHRGGGKRYVVRRAAVAAESPAGDVA